MTGLRPVSPVHQWRTREKFWGFKGMAGLVGGAGANPRMPENFRKFRKNFVRKLQKLHYFSLFFKKLKIHALYFRAFGRKTQLVGEILRKF